MYGRTLSTAAVVILCGLAILVMAGLEVELVKVL
jgi:hypothetical protein